MIPRRHGDNSRSGPHNRTSYGNTTVPVSFNGEVEPHSLRFLHSVQRVPQSLSNHHQVRWSSVRSGSAQLGIDQHDTTAGKVIHVLESRFTLCGQHFTITFDL